MTSHAYDYMCGCAECCRTESARELDDATREAYCDDLVACPDFIAELALENEEAERVAAAMQDNDMKEVGLALISALYRAADDLVAARAKEFGITSGEAAERMYELYRPATRDGIQRGNEGIDAGTWTPPGKPERPPLPGHEHTAPLHTRTWRDK